MIECIRADSKKFAVYHTAYADSNIFMRFNWDERINGIPEGLDRYFICRNGNPVGGFALTGNRLSYPFMIPPFCDRRGYWDTALRFAARISGQKEVCLNEIPESDAAVLTELFGAVLRWSNRRMLRPTEPFEAKLKDGFQFDGLAEKDLPEIVQAVYQAHATGYTSTVREPDLAETEAAIVRRFDLFTQTGSLYMGNLVRDTSSRKIAGVCIAGIYPDSPDNFSTLHQVSVRPEYRRNGIAEAMILKALGNASPVSPVMTLGVLIGNPAELLYRKIGFAPGPAYSELLWTLRELPAPDGESSVSFRFQGAPIHRK